MRGDRRGEEATATTTVVVDAKGGFDAAAAHATAALLRGVRAVTLDFTSTPHVDPLALAVLVRELSAGGERAVRYVGLGRHEERLLRYLGARVAARAADVDPATEPRGVHGAVNDADRV